MVDLDIKSETIDKALDKLVEPVYNDAVKPAINTSKNTLGFCSQFIVSGIKPFMYKRIKECEYKIVEIDKKLEEKYNQIPDKNKTEPRTNILGPAVDVLKYNLEEDYIKDMFINLISKDLDKTQQSKVLPSYIEIVKQLSKEDAETLTIINDYVLDNAPIIQLKYDLEDGGFSDFDKSVFLIVDINTYHKFNPIIIDNLCRLNLIEIDFSKYLKDFDGYEKTFESIKPLYNAKAFPQNVTKLNFYSGILRVTNFGENFMDICLS